jgi:hypothetical protein
METKKIDWNGVDMAIFPREKKTAKTPNFGGSVGRGKDMKIGDVIFYRNTTKTGTWYLNGYIKMIDETKKVRVEIQSQQYENLERPAIQAAILIDDVWHDLKLWQKEYAKGNYYSGKIGSPQLDGTVRP